MITATVEWDLRRVDEALQEIKRRGKSTRRVFMEVAPELRDEIKQHFAQALGPEGGWPALAVSTEAERTRKGRAIAERGKTKRGKLTRRTIRRLGKHFAQPLLGYKMPSALGLEVGRDFVEVRNTVKWSAIHDEGGQAGRGGRSRIPRRQFMFASERLLSSIGERLVDYLVREGA